MTEKGRYIDRYRLFIPKGFLEEEITVGRIFDLLEKQEAVDAVKVVRCKECKYCQLKDGFNVCDYLCAVVLEDWYCWNGEEREKETNS